MSVNEEFNNAMLAHSRKKELLIRLLQKEEIGSLAIQLQKFLEHHGRNAHHSRSTGMVR